MENKCIFCNIIERKTDTKIEFENDSVVIFKDIKAASHYHYLAVSKIHIESIKSLKICDKPLIDNMETSLREHMEQKGLDSSDAVFGFHWPPFISVKHLHMHAIAPKSNMSTISKLVFKPGTMWFSTTEYARSWLK